MNNFYDNTYEEQVFGYSDKILVGEGLGDVFSKIFSKVGEVFTKKAVEEAGKKVVQDVGKKALEQGTQFLTDKASEQLDKVFSNNKVETAKPVAVSNNSDNMSREEIRRMKEVVNRIRRRRMRELEDDE